MSAWEVMLFDDTWQAGGARGDGLEGGSGEERGRHVGEFQVVLHVGADLLGHEGTV